jgi:hypothetical protein
MKFIKIKNFYNNYSDKMNKIKKKILINNRNNKTIMLFLFQVKIIKKQIKLINKE